jgi:uncharacterized alpha-E superfamily protein
MLLSRVADALYWISRYLERAEHTARLVDVRLDLGLDRLPNSDRWDFEPLYEALRAPGAAMAPASPSGLIDVLVFDPANPGSVLACVTAARENARQVREEISSDMWEQVNAMYLRLKQARVEGVWSARPHYVSRLVIEGVHLFEGVTDATMGHGEGWQYLQLGRFLERAGATAALVDQHFRGRAFVAANSGRWAGLLRCCSALESYCRCYTADIRPERVTEFLLLNAEFPRSVRFAAARVEAAIRALAQLTGRGSGGRAERLAGRLHASLDYGQIDEILSDDPHGYLDAIGRYCDQVHLAAAQCYVTYPIESALPA